MQSGPYGSSFMYNSVNNVLERHPVMVDISQLFQMFADLKCSPSCTRAGIHGTVCIYPPDCFEYKGTLDVFYKIIRQEGVARLWRGTNAGLALAVPTVRPCLSFLSFFLLSTFLIPMAFW
ncbi:hypothetical protein L1887_17275 [Cichorium endivia]|nr:hypothetical protein L1887_17275 [Cichorium endivia]